MNIFRKNSFVPKQTPGFRIVPFQPVRKDLSRAVKAGEGDMIELSYSHDKPSDASNVMPPVYRTFKLPELEGDGKHIVTASGSVDDAVRLTVDGSTKSSSSGAAHSFYLSIEGLSAGIHSLYVQHTNISDYPDPPGNVSMISGTVGACPPVSIVPKDNVEIRCECECTDDNEGGYPSPTSLYRVNSAVDCPPKEVPI